MKVKKGKERREAAKELEQSIHLVKPPSVLAEDPSLTLPKIKVTVSKHQTEENHAMEEWFFFFTGLYYMCLSLLFFFFSFLCWKRGSLCKRCFSTCNCRGVNPVMAGDYDIFLPFVAEMILFLIILQLL